MQPLDSQVMQERIAQVNATIADNVRTHGWAVTGVFPLEDSPSPFWFAYTIGLWENLHHPELMVFGLQLRSAQVVFANIQARIVAGETFVDGQQVTGLVRGDYPLAFRYAPVDHDEWAMGTANVYYRGRDYPSLQVVLPDTHKLFPWQPGCWPDMVLSQQALWGDGAGPRCCARRGCQRVFVRRDAGPLGWVWGCPIHSEYWQWPGGAVDPNTMDAQHAIEDRHE